MLCGKGNCRCGALHWLFTTADFSRLTSYQLNAWKRYTLKGYSIPHRLQYLWHPLPLLFIYKKHLKNVGPIRHCEPPHANSPGVASGTVAHRLRIDVHDDDNNNAWQRGPLWPHGMGPIRNGLLQMCVTIVAFWTPNTAWLVGVWYANMVVMWLICQKLMQWVSGIWLVYQVT